MGDAGPARAAARPGPGAPLRIDVERACFALALQRLCAPGSDLQGAAWVRTVESPGFEALELQHLYRTVGGLAQVRPELETDLFWRDRDLFSQSLDLVFIETTSTYIYRTEGTPRRCRGYSRDRRRGRSVVPNSRLCDSTV